MRRVPIPNRFADGVNATPELEVVGKPDMCVVAFGARPGSSVNIYKVGRGCLVRSIPYLSLIGPQLLRHVPTCKEDATASPVIAPHAQTKP